jgi:antitoxin component YwqK of YwqJK toxin-antitoxin module
MLLTPEIAFQIAIYIDDSSALLVWFRAHTKLYLNHPYWRDHLPKLICNKKKAFIIEYDRSSTVHTGDMMIIAIKHICDYSALYPGECVYTSIYSPNKSKRQIYSRSRSRSKNGLNRLQGPCTVYGPKSIITCSFNMGLLHGEYKEMRAGKPLMTGRFKNGLFDGEWVMYDLMGKLITKTTYKDGKFIK